MSGERGPTTEELRARALAAELRTPLPAGEAVGALLLTRPCMACGRNTAERMCDLCQRLEVAEASAER